MWFFSSLGDAHKFRSSEISILNLSRNLQGKRKRRAFWYLFVVTWRDVVVHTCVRLRRFVFLYLEKERRIGVKRTHPGVNLLRSQMSPLSFCPTSPFYLWVYGKVSMTHTCQAGMRSKTIFRTPLLRLWTSDVLFRATCYTSLCRSVVFPSNNKWSNRKRGWPRNKGKKTRKEKILTREYSF